MEKQTSSHKLRNMTEGSIAGHLLAFAFPMFLGSLLQQLYNMVDSWVVGRFVSEAALAAVGIGYPVIFMFTSLFMGLSNGTTVTIAQYYGAGKMERVRDVVDTTYTFFTLAVVPITVVALLIARPVLVLMRVEDAAMGEAYLYLMIVSGGLIGTIGYNINSGILQGVGNSRASLLFLGISAVMNIVLDLLFVLQFHWGVAGVAIATIISQFCSWIFGVFYINRNYTAFAIRPFCLRFDKGLFKKIMGIGLPAGIQFATVSMGMMAVMSQVNLLCRRLQRGQQAGQHGLPAHPGHCLCHYRLCGAECGGQEGGPGPPGRIHRYLLLHRLVCADHCHPIPCPVCRRVLLYRQPGGHPGGGSAAAVYPALLPLLCGAVHHVQRDAGGGRERGAHADGGDQSGAAAYPRSVSAGPLLRAGLYVLWLWDRLDLWFHRYRALLPLRPLEAPGQSGGVKKHDREGLSGFTGTGPLSCHHKHRNTP